MASAGIDPSWRRARGGGDDSETKDRCSDIELKLICFANVSVLCRVGTVLIGLNVLLGLEWRGMARNGAEWLVPAAGGPRPPLPTARESARCEENAR